MLENVREVTVVINLDKTRNPFAGMVDWLESLRDLNFNGKVDIWQSRFGREERRGLQRSTRS